MEGLCEGCTKCETRYQTGLISNPKMEGLCKDCTKCERRYQTGLLSAAQHGHHKCVEVLIKSGADVNSLDKYGDTALMLAAASGFNKIGAEWKHKMC